MATRKPAAKAPAKKSTAKLVRPRSKVEGTPHDWEAIERDYRTGRFTDRELGVKYGLTHGAIGKHMRERGIRKDLTDAVRRATNAAVIEAEVSKRAEGQVSKAVASGIQAALDTVTAAAELNKSVILRHRTDINEARNVAMDLLGELRLTTHKTEEIEALFEQSIAEMVNSPAKTAAVQAFRDFMRLHSRIASVHKLADTLNKLQDRERIAFGLDDKGKQPGDDPYEHLTTEELYAKLQEYERRG